MKQNITRDSPKQSKLNFIWFFIRPYKLRILALFILFLLAGGLEAATIAAIYPILNAAFSPGAGQGNFILSLFNIIANLLSIKDLFISYCTIFLLFAVLAFIVKYFSITFRTRFIAHLVSKKQDEIFSKFIRADYQYFVDHKQGDLIYNVTAAPMQLDILISSVTDFISQGLLSISVLLLLFSLSWQGASGVLVVGIVYLFLTRYLGKKISYRASEKEMKALRERNVILNEGISGIKQIKAFATGENWIANFSKTIKESWANSIKRSIGQQIPPIALLLILYLGVGTVILLIKFFDPLGFMALIPVFGAFAFAVFRLLPFVTSIGNTIMNIQSSLPGCEVMYNILNENLTHVENGDREFKSFKSNISFENVSFTYKGRSRTLKDFSVVFKKGETTAIVGRSGSGKTTIVNLLLRLFDVDTGEVKIDGYNIKEYKLEFWLNHVGYVSQDSFILNDTVENNITFSSNGYSREAVIKAAKYADANDFICELPDGYDTIVGDKGTRLSGGQAQRIAVARAMIREPEILIFDEATNNLDNISEVAVQKAIEEISKDHTVIVVAHRLSTIANADKILVIENGRLKEEGSHQELLEKKGSYWKLYQSQPQ